MSDDVMVRVNGSVISIGEIEASARCGRSGTLEDVSTVRLPNITALALCREARRAAILEVGIRQLRQDAREQSGINSNVSHWYDQRLLSLLEETP